MKLPLLEEAMESVSALAAALEHKRPKLWEQASIWITNTTPRYPWRQAGKSAYQVLVGELWLKRTNPSIAVHIYRHFTERFPHIQDLAQAKDVDLSEALYNFGALGLCQHAKEIATLAGRLIREGKGHLPRDSESLKRVSGLDKHVIQAIMCFGYGLPLIVIDANVARMLLRLFSDSVSQEFSEGLINVLGGCLLSEREPHHCSRALLELSEVICREQEPLCPRCLMARICDYRVSLLANPNNPRTLDSLGQMCLDANLQPV
jgi:A/G-specific adenine glycosylase